MVFSSCRITRRYHYELQDRATLEYANDFALNFLTNNLITYSIIWDKVIKNGPSKNCGRQPVKTFI